MNFITDENFDYYAIKHYDNPSCRGLEEFQSDLRRFRYLKRLFRKYKVGRGLKERLIVNHLVILNNLFGTEPMTQMLFFKIEKEHWPQLKTFLVFLNFMPIGLTINTQDTIVQGYEIPLDEKILKVLGKL